MSKIDTDFIILDENPIYTNQISENQNIRSIVPKTADDGQCLKEYREGAVILCERHIPLMPISVRSSKWSCRVQGAVILNRRYTLTLEDYGTLEIPI
jgi:hypothetical protein